MHMYIQLQRHLKHKSVSPLSTLYAEQDIHETHYIYTSRGTQRLNIHRTNELPMNNALQQSNTHDTVTSPQQGQDGGLTWPGSGRGRELAISSLPCPYFQQQTSPQLQTTAIASSAIRTELGGGVQGGDLPSPQLPYTSEHSYCHSICSLRATGERCRQGHFFVVRRKVFPQGIFGTCTWYLFIFCLFVLSS